MTDMFPVDRRSLLIGAAALATAPALATVGGTTAHAAPPQLGPDRPFFYRAKLGKFEITTILDGFVQADGPHPIYGVDQPANVVQAFAKRNFLSETRMEISYTPVVVNTGNEVIIFDTGNGGAMGRRPTAGKLAAQITQAGIRPDEVDIVVITHCHGDHIGGIMEDGKPLFPNARYVIGEKEYDFWSSKDRLSGATEDAAKLVQANVVVHAEKMSFLKDGGEVVSGIRTVNAFGHTPGMYAFHLESEGKRLLITGDTVNHFVMSLMKPEWHTRFDMDKEAGVATRKRILDMLAADRIPFAGYHMPFPAIGYVEKTADGYRWVQASYQLHL